MPQSVRKAIFPVGGLGTRFLPATKAIPKEMLTVVDKPLIQYAVEEALAAGIEELVFVTGRGKSAIEDHFDRCLELEDALSNRGKARQLAEARACILRPGQIAYVRQQQPLGLGHAVWCARHLVGDEPFAVILADDLIHSPGEPCLRQMVDAYESVGGNMVAVMEVAESHLNRYGILDIGAGPGRGPLVPALGVVEKPAPERAPSSLAIIGRYILDPAVLARLDETPPGAGGEIQLTDGIAATLEDTPLHGFRFAGRRFDCGDKVGFIEANVALALARPDLALATWSALQNYRPFRPAGAGRTAPRPAVLEQDAGLAVGT